MRHFLNLSSYSSGSASWTRWPTAQRDDVLGTLEPALGLLAAPCFFSNGPGSTRARSRPTDGFSAMTSVLAMRRGSVAAGRTAAPGQRPRTGPVDTRPATGAAGSTAQRRDDRVGHAVAAAGGPRRGGREDRGHDAAGGRRRAARRSCPAAPRRGRSSSRAAPARGRRRPAEHGRASRPRRAARTSYGPLRGKPSTAAAVPARGLAAPARSAGAPRPGTRSTATSLRGSKATTARVEPRRRRRATWTDRVVLARRRRGRW